MVIDDLQEVLMADYLRIPHMVLKMQQVLKNPSAYLCLQFIWYKTGGWNKGRDTIAYSQFKNDPNGTGASIKTIERSVKLLIEKNLIHATPSFNNMSEYSLNFDTIRALACGEQAPSKSLSLDEQAPSICLGLDEASPVNLSASHVNLSASPVNLSDKPRQIDVHNRYYTKDTNTINTNTTDNAVLSVSDNETESVEKPVEEKPVEEKPKTPAKKKAVKKTEPKFNPLEITLPEYVDTELWAGFHQMRLEIKKGATEYACKLMLSDLAEWHSKGLDVNASIKKSVINKWTGIFEPKERLQQANSQFTSYRKTADPLAVNDAWGYDAPMTDAERREYLNLPTIDSNDGYGQPAFDFASQGVTQL